MLIYLVTNKINHKQYVGQTVRSLGLRKGQHNRNASARKDNYYFHNALRKHGIDNFEWQIIHDNVNTIEELNRLEIYYIGYYDTYNNGYNQTLGGNGSVGYKHSEESKRKMSKIHKGKTISEANRLRISIAFSGKNHPNYGKCGDKHPMYGKKHTKQTRKNHSRPVIINGKYFYGIKKASECLNIHRATINYRLKVKKPGYLYADGGDIKQKNKTQRI